MDPSNKTQKVLGIIGCGWLGTAVGAHFIQHNWIVKGTRRSEEKMAQINKAYEVLSDKKLKAEYDKFCKLL